MGEFGITVLGYSNYVVDRPEWNSAVGAVTWSSSTSGQVSGFVEQGTNNLIFPAIEWSDGGHHGTNV